MYTDMYTVLSSTHDIFTKSYARINTLNTMFWEICSKCNCHASIDHKINFGNCEIRSKCVETRSDFVSV